MRVAMYVRVSRLDQQPENQILELRRYVAARGWEAREFVEHGVSGNKDRRPALDALLAEVRRRRVEVVVCWKLDRLGRNLTHLVNTLQEFRALAVEFVTLGEGIDTSTPAGRLMFGLLASIAEFERERLRERTILGLDRARAQGVRLGRRPDRALRARIAAVAHLSVRKAAAAVGCSVTTIQRCRRQPEAVG